MVLHGTQTLDLLPILCQLGAAVIWTCHVGIDEPNDVTREAWEFLGAYAHLADRVVLSRQAYAWDVLDRELVEAQLDGEDDRRSTRLRGRRARDPGLALGPAEGSPRSDGGFCRYMPEALNAELVLAGPSPDSVAGDPEGGQTLEELWDA